MHDRLFEMLLESARLMQRDILGEKVAAGAFEVAPSASASDRRVGALRARTKQTPTRKQVSTAKKR